MATTSIWKIGKCLNNAIDYVANKDKTNKNQDYVLKDLKDAVNYASNSDKTEESYYISGINCEPEYAYKEMVQTKKAFGKTEGIQGFHGYQSFKEGEVTPEIAHEIGFKLASEMWGDRFEVLVTTHLNTKHFHNHFVVNSVSFKDGLKYRNTRENYAEFRRLNDEICKEYGLNVLEEKITGKNLLDYRNYQNKYSNNYYKTAKRDLDLAIREAVSYKDFEQLLTNIGYEITYRAGKISIRGNDYKRNIRIERYFGEEYSIENITRRIFVTDKSFARINNIKKPNRKYHGFIGLYKYYCYLLKIYPKNARTHKIPLSLKKDIDRMEIINKETRFLVSNNIETKDDLYKLINHNVSELDRLSGLRENLWRRYSKTDDEISKLQIKTEIDKTKKEIDKKREELKLCEGIDKRVNNIEDSINEYEKEIGREVEINESIK